METLFVHPKFLMPVCMVPGDNHQKMAKHNRSDHQTNLICIFFLHILHVTDI